MKAASALAALLLLLGAAARAAAPDLATPPFPVIRAGWLAEKAALDSARLRAYRDMLETRRDEMETELREKSSARNITGILVARRALELCNESLDAVRTNNNFAVPEKVRRELTDWLAKLAAEKEAADTRADAALAQARNKHKARFAAALARQTGAPPPAAELEALFLQLLADDAPAPDAPDAPGTEPAPPAPEPEPDSPWFAASGEAENWVTAGRWTADIMARDVFSIPILNMTGSYQAVKTHPLAGEPSPFSYEVLQPIPADPGVTRAYRLKRLPDRLPVSVMAWPSLQNRGRLEFRTQPVSEFPSPHGFELETAVLAAAQPGATPFEVQVETAPPGAEIQINGRRVIDGAGNTARSPTRFKIAPGSYTISLHLRDHVTKTVEKWNPRHAPRVAWTFQHETNLPPTRTVKLDPAKGWTSSELPVRIGDRLWILPAGQWHIGARGEPCSAAGYPDTPAFAHYHQGGTELRQVEDAPYGALLVRIGHYAEPIAVTNAMLFRVPANGIPFFDTNEKADKDLRRHNRGQMTVRLVHIPFAP